jgi:hypothetical protein
MWRGGYPGDTPSCERASLSGNAISSGERRSERLHRIAGTAPSSGTGRSRCRREAGEQPAELPGPSDAPRLRAHRSWLPSPRGCSQCSSPGTMRHGDAQGSARAATDAQAQARLAEGRAIMAVSGAEGAGGIKPENGLEGIESSLDHSSLPSPGGRRRMEDALEGIEGTACSIRPRPKRAWIRTEVTWRGNRTHGVCRTHSLVRPTRAAAPVRVGVALAAA